MESRIIAEAYMENESYDLKIIRFLIPIDSPDLSLYLEIEFL